MTSPASDEDDESAEWSEDPPAPRPKEKAPPVQVASTRAPKATGKPEAKKEAHEPEEEPEEETWEDRLAGALPFLFGGGLALFFAYTLRSAPSRSGVPPLWVLFLTLGVLALGAGVLLAISREPDDEEEGSEDHVVVPRKEWDRLQSELSRLRTRGASTPNDTAGGSPPVPPPSRGPPPTDAPSPASSSSAETPAPASASKADPSPSARASALTTGSSATRASSS